MKLSSWFGGCIGWMVGGPLGALLGFVIGSMVGKNENDADRYIPGSQDFGHASHEDPTQAARDNFIFSMLVMSAYVIEADGRIMHSEMEYVRGYFRRQFGEAGAQQADMILRSLFKQNIDVDGCGRQMAQNLSYGERLQILSYLAGIARADGSVVDVELVALRRVATAMQLDANEVDSMLNLGGNTLDAAYKVLEVSSTASDDDVRLAYRRLVLKNHPDRVATLGEDIRRNAEEKLKQINAAYDRVCKARGMR